MILNMQVLEARRCDGRETARRDSRVGGWRDGVSREMRKDPFRWGRERAMMRTDESAVVLEGLWRGCPCAPSQADLHGDSKGHAPSWAARPEPRGAGRLRRREGLSEVPASSMGEARAQHPSEGAEDLREAP